MWFDGWEVVLRTLAVGTASYVALVALLRISGKRTLSKWNAFDLVVTVALGSSFATALLSKQTTFVQVAVGFGLLVALQLAVTWCSVRVGWMDRLVKARPVYLLRDGQPLARALRRERITLSELRAAVRGKGIARLQDVAAVVLETDGSFSVLKSVSEPATALEDVEGRSID